MRTIRVYGSLAKFLGKRVFKADVISPAEAVRFLVTNFPNLREHMADRHYKVSVGSVSLPIGEHPRHLHLPSGQEEVIKVIPAISGAGSSTTQILVGIGLIAASFLLPGAGIFGATSVFGATAGTGIGTALGTVFSAVGASLVLGGVASLLTPTPQTAIGVDSESDPRKSFSFSGIQNVTRQGVPVPIVYGETIVGSVVISAGLNVDQVAV